jgi:hypothetical protein
MTGISILSTLNTNQYEFSIFHPQSDVFRKRRNLMDQLNLAGILTIAGFLLIILASIAGPPRLYQEPDVQKQIEILEDHSTRWVISNIMFGLGGVVTAAGLILFSILVQGQVNTILNWLAALCYSLGTLLWILFLYNRTVNPSQLFENYSFSPSTIALIGLLLSSLLLYGIVYIQAGYPGWLGFGTISLTVLIGILALVFPARFFASFPPQILYFFTLAAGIVFLRN